MSAPASSIPWRARLGWTRASYLVLSLFFTTILVIGLIWWPLLADYVGTFDPRFPWWAQVDWLLLAVFATGKQLPYLANLRAKMTSGQGKHRSGRIRLL